MNTSYARLEQKFARIAVLNEASAMLGWDASAMMPDGGAEARGEQLATLAGLAHEFLSAPDIAEELEAAQPQITCRARNLVLPAQSTHRLASTGTNHKLHSLVSHTLTT